MSREGKVKKWPKGTPVKRRGSADGEIGFVLEYFDKYVRVEWSSQLPTSYFTPTSCEWPSEICALSAEEILTGEPVYEP